MTFNLSILLAFAIGVIIGAIAAVKSAVSKPEALLGIDTSDPEKDMYKFVILCPLDELRKQRYIVVEVMNSTDISRNI